MSDVLTYCPGSQVYALCEASATTTSTATESDVHWEGIGRVCRDPEGHQTNGILTGQSKSIPLDQCKAECLLMEECIGIEYDQSEIDASENGCEFHRNISREITSGTGTCT